MLAGSSRSDCPRRLSLGRAMICRIMQTIVIVEDDPDIRRLLELELRERALVAGAAASKSRSTPASC
jgi:hypothetical protein